MFLQCVLGLAIAATALANSDNGGCRCAREVAESGQGQVQCPRACFNDYVPVCGFNPCIGGGSREAFKTFDSRCRQESTVCDGPGYLYYFVYNGTCESKY